MSAVSTSPITAASNRFVADRLGAARELGERLPGLVSNADEFTATLAAGFAALADPTYAAGVRSVTPGLGPVFGVRQPLMAAAHRAFRRGARQAPPDQLLDCVARLFHEEHRELRWFGIWMFSRTLPGAPDATWQLMRQAAGGADEWITVDTLAHPYGEGILADSGRWLELERLLSSPSRWERRLVGSTVATMPHGGAARQHGSVIRDRGLALMTQLIGDDEPDVQKALSWALRSLADLDRPATTAYLLRQTATARATADGHRAWVIRDTLTKLEAPDAARIRAGLEGIRRRPGLGSTSLAAAHTTQRSSTP